MLRVRMDGGQLTSAQLRTVAEIAQTFGRDVADVTDRQNVQLHWIRIEDVPESGAGWRPSGCPAPRRAGTSPGSSSAARWRASRRTRSSTRPPSCRRRSSATSATRTSPTCPASSRARSPAAPTSARCMRSTTSPSSAWHTPSWALGYDLWVGGGLSTAPMLGQRLGGFVQPHLVADTWAGVTALFRDYGYRRSRNRARLKFLVRDWGPQRIREVLEAEYLKEPLPDGPAPAPPKTDSRDHVGVAQQRDGRFSVGMALRAGRTSGTSLRALADLAEEYGSGRIRTTTHQKAIVLDVPDDRVEQLVGELDQHGFAVRPAASGAPRWPVPASSTASWRSSRRSRGPTTWWPSSSPAPRLRRCGGHPPQRLSELVRPLPGRRHRAQRLDRRRRRGLPAAPGRPRAGSRGWRASCAA